MLFQIFFIVIYITSILGNYYEILGVSRSATDFDIKKAYKKLAKKWHPDKNRSPEANERFTKINEAYEALSNTEKRKEYDAFGSISNEPRDSARNHGNFWGGGNTFFDFGQNEQAESHFESTNYRHYKIDILPNSYLQPTLILLVSHFCFSCHHAIRIWGSIADQIIESGIRISIADVMADAHLREELRIHHVPTVVMVIEGQVRYLQLEISKEAVIDFIRYSFPKDLIHTIQTEEELNLFHDSWFRDSRSKMIMTKPLDRPSFRYLSIAFKYRDKISAGFIYLNEKSQQLTKISKAYNVRTNEETVIIFHDEKHYYPSNVMLPKPIAMQSQVRLTLSNIESLVLTNHMLPFPRLLSQTIFDLACPPPSQKQPSFGFCVITVVHSKHKNNLSESDSWQYVRSLIGDHDGGKMMYLFGDVQYQFLKSLQLVDPADSSIDMFMDQVILLWRQSYSSATSLFLANPWQYSTIDMVLRNWDLLSNFDKAVSILKTRNQIQNEVTDSDALSELVDELAAPLWIKIGLRLLSYARLVYVYLYEVFTEPFNLVIAFLTVALASYVYSTIQAVSAHLTDERKESRFTSSTQNHQSTMPKPSLEDITSESYSSLLKEVRPGRLICVVLTSENTSPGTLALVQDSVARMKCDSRLQPMTLRLDTHNHWVKSLLSSMDSEDDRRHCLSSLSGLAANRPYAYEGVVLALNLARCYWSLCPLNLIHRRRRGRRNNSHSDSVYDRLSFDLDSSSSDCSSDNEDDDGWAWREIGDEVRGRFFDWLCQLMEGTCKRYRVVQWPACL